MRRLLVTISAILVSQFALSAPNVESESTADEEPTRPRAILCKRAGVTLPFFKSHYLIYDLQENIFWASDRRGKKRKNPITIKRIEYGPSQAGASLDGRMWTQRNVLRLVYTWPYTQDTYKHRKKDVHYASYEKEFTFEVDLADTDDLPRGHAAMEIYGVHYNLSGSDAPENKHYFGFADNMTSCYALAVLPQ